jgi:hypothetical protein
MSLSSEMVDAEVVKYGWVGPNFVIIRLQDGTECRLQIDARVSRVKDARNPDGTPQYIINWNVLPSFKNPVGTKIKVPRPQAPTQNTKPPDQRLAQ